MNSGRVVDYWNLIITSRSQATILMIDLKLMPTFVLHPLSFDECVLVESKERLVSIDDAMIIPLNP